MTYASSITDGVTTTERTVSHDAIGFALDEATYYYVKNTQGDVLCVVNETGAPVLYYTYDAWGSFTVTPAAGASNQEVLLVAILNPATYRGYFYDHELGLYYLQSRYYDPETGRFINAGDEFDTQIGSTGTNMFLYNSSAVKKEQQEAANSSENRIKSILSPEVTSAATTPSGWDIITVNCYSGNWGHADITIDGTIYSYGNYASKGRSHWDQIFGKADGYVIWANPDSWYTKEKKNGRKRFSYSFTVSDDVKYEILAFYSDLLNRSTFDRMPVDYYGVIYKINSGQYRYYSLLTRNCVTAVINALDLGISEKMHHVSEEMYQSSDRYKTMFLLVQLEWFMDYFLIEYPDTILTKG